MEEFKVQPVDVAKKLAARRRSPHTEAHWAPRSDRPASPGSSVGQEFATISRELGDRDWASIDPRLLSVHDAATRITVRAALDAGESVEAIFRSQGIAY